MNDTVTHIETTTPRPQATLSEPRAGIPRAQAGASAKQGKYTAFIQEYSTFLQGAVAQVKGMPKGTLQQSIARSSSMITASYNWGQQRNA